MLINNISISVVVTVKNDEAGVKRLLEDLDKQTVKPDEIIIVRSEDYGNCTRGRGRNIGIRMARNEFIAVTDAGCRPRRDWVERITAGLYKGLAFPDIFLSGMGVTGVRRKNLGKLPEW